MATGSDSLDRHRFLALAGLAGAGVALGRGRAAPAATSHTGTAAGMEHLAGGSGVDFAGLKALAGPLLLPGDSGGRPRSRASPTLLM